MSRVELENAIRDLVRTVMDGEEFPDGEWRLSQMGFDSMRMIRLVVQIEERFCISIDDVDYGELDSIKTLVDHVERLGGSAR